MALLFNIQKIIDEGYSISTDPLLLDIPKIHEYLAQSYWAQKIPISIVEVSIKNSLCFGIYLDGNQVGFGRVISDFATFAYLADVFVLAPHRGKGLSKWLIATIKDHPKLQYLRRFMLGTKDAHGLYTQFGFEPLKDPTVVMAITNPNLYLENEKNQ